MAVARRAVGERSLRLAPELAQARSLLGLAAARRATRARRSAFGAAASVARSASCALDELAEPAALGEALGGGGGAAGGGGEAVPAPQVALAR